MRRSDGAFLRGLPEGHPKSSDILEILAKSAFADARHADHPHSLNLPYKRQPRTAEDWEFKAPEGNGYLTIKNQLKSVLYGNDHSVLNPKSDKIVISNVRSDMTMDDMINGLSVAIDPDEGLSPEELESLSEVILLDRNGEMVRITIKKS